MVIGSFPSLLVAITNPACIIETHISEKSFSLTIEISSKNKFAIFKQSLILSYTYTLNLSKSLGSIRGLIDSRYNPTLSIINLSLMNKS
jgi:hypothetical protein